MSLPVQRPKLSGPRLLVWQRREVHGESWLSQIEGKGNRKELKGGEVGGFLEGG